jgi:type I restriction enzyme S subunit
MMNYQNVKKYPAYKDSGVEWIGEIPVGWEMKRLKHVATINNGLDYKKIESEKGYPVFGSGGRFATASKYLCNQEAVLLGRKGTIDKPIYINEKFWTVDTMFYAVCKNAVSTKFIFYICTTIPFKYYSTSTALPSMTQTDLLNLILFIPPLPEQTAIANFLDEKCNKIDRAVAQKEKLVALLKERKQIVIQNAVTKGLNPNAKMKDSGVEWIGEIPEGWEVQRLASFGKFTKGGGFSKSDLQEKGERAILYGDIYTIYDYFFIDAKKFISSNNSKKSSEIKKGDLLFTGSGETLEDIGKCVAFYGNKKTYAGGDIIIFKQSRYNSLYLSYALNSELLKQEKAKTAKGEIIVHTYASKLKNIYIPIPSLNIQAAIVSHIKTQSQKINKAITLQQNQIEKLKEYKSILINNAVTGKIKVC